MNGFRKPTETRELEADEKIASFIHERLGCKDALTLKFIGVALICIRVFDYKQGKYGPGNIAKFGEMGVMVRVSDKLERIINLYKTGQEPLDETRDDSWGDFAVYSIITLMCRWGFWPGVKPAFAEGGMVKSVPATIGEPTVGIIERRAL